MTETKDKIDRLVEWVADGISVTQCASCRGSGEVCERCSYPNSYDLARLILNHSNLYYRDLDVEVTGLSDLYKAFISIKEVLNAKETH